MREPSRTKAAKLPHTCGLVDEILIVRMVKVESNPLFCNQRVWDRVLRMVASFRFICAQTFCNKLGRCSPSSFLKAFPVTSSFVLLP